LFLYRTRKLSPPAPIDEVDYTFFSPEYHLKGKNILLVGGSEEDIAAFAGIELRTTH
jgi:hypothetical protein